LLRIIVNIKKILFQAVNISIVLNKVKHLLEIVHFYPG